jgi:DNA-binding XRE family transcriptional regulator
MAIKATKQGDDEDRPIDWSKAKPLGRGLHAKRGVRLSLRTLREGAGKTQVEMAELLGINQTSVSRLEHREDTSVSTLRRYAEALGAKLEVVFVFEQGHRIVADV